MTMNQIIQEQEDLNSITAVEFFNALDDKALIEVIKANQLQNLCWALSIDLQPQVKDESPKVYLA